MAEGRELMWIRGYAPRPPLSGLSTRLSQDFSVPFWEWDWGRRGAGSRAVTHTHTPHHSGHPTCFPSLHSFKLDGVFFPCLWPH